MRKSLLALFLFFISALAQATSSLSFEAGGYLMDIVVGDDAKPVITAVHLATPHASTPAQLPLRSIKVARFDSANKVLVLAFKKPTGSTLPNDFHLAVKGDAATLKIDGQMLSGKFYWGQ